MLTFPLLNNKKIIKLKEDMWNLLQKTFRITSDFEAQYVQVTREYIARPDLLSLHLYNTSNYADVLCKLNGISNPFELNEGMIIAVPRATDIFKFYVIEDKVDNSLVKDEKVSVKNLQKKKNESRKANEQVLGDRNFRIDKNNKIVIY